MKLSDRMKTYERQEAGRRAETQTPICVRIDGKRFSRFTRGLTRPFDSRLIDLMQATTRFLLAESQASIAFTQSDEITLIWSHQDPAKQMNFDGRYQKLASVLAAQASVFFNRHLAETLPEKADQMPVFDCRVWQVPDLNAAAEVLLWRELDAIRNSIQMAAQAVFSRRQMHKQSTRVLVQCLAAEGIDWEAYPTAFKRGSFYQHQTIQQAFRAEELASLPPMHRAHRNPDLQFERSVIQALKLPPLTEIANLAEVLFAQAEPRYSNK